MAVIRALAEADLPQAQRIVRVAFGTFLGAPDPEHFWSDLDYVYGRSLPDAASRFLRRSWRGPIDRPMFTGEARIPLLSAVAIDDGPVPNLPGFEEPGRDQLVNLRAANAIQAAKLGD